MTRLKVFSKDTHLSKINFSTMRPKIYFLSVMCLLQTVVGDGVLDHKDKTTTITNKALKQRELTIVNHRDERGFKRKNNHSPLKHPADVDRSDRVAREVYHYEIDIHNSSCQLSDPEDPMFYMCGSRCISVEDACDDRCTNIGAERWMCNDGKQCLRKYLYYEYLEGVPTEPAHGDRWSHGRCMDRKGCYQNYLCDGTIQCGDGSDEYLLTCYQELWWIWVLIIIVILGIALIVSLFCLGWCVCNCRKSSKEKVSESTTLTMEI